MQSCSNTIRKLDSIELLSINLDGNSNKEVVYDISTNKKLILKQQKTHKGIPYNDHIAEHLTCSILNECGFNTQETELVIYKRQLVVAITLKQEIKQLLQMKSYFNDGNKIVFDVGNIMALAQSTKPAVDMTKFKEHLLDLILISHVFCNKDLHPGNIGFVKSKTGVYIPSEIYDMAGSLLSLYAFDSKKRMKKELELSSSVKIFNKEYKVSDLIDNTKFNKLHSQLKTKQPQIIKIIESLPEPYKEFGYESYKMILRRSKMEV